MSDKRSGVLVTAAVIVEILYYVVLIRAMSNNEANWDAWAYYHITRVCRTAALWFGRTALWAEASYYRTVGR